MLIDRAAPCERSLADLLVTSDMMPTIPKTVTTSSCATGLCLLGAEADVELMKGR